MKHNIFVFIKKYHLAIILGSVVFFILFIMLLPKGVAFYSYNNNGIISLGINSSNKITINDPIVMQVRLNTQGKSINAVGLTLHFNPSLLTVKSVDSTTSFCTFYIERKYDIQKGTVTLFCGKPKPGFSGSNILETITFQSLGYGESEISVDPKSMVLENNGKGTNILHSFETQKISVILSQ